MRLALILTCLFWSPVLAQGDKGATKTKSKDRWTVGVLLFDGVELMDFSGPAEVFIVADNGRRFKVFTVASRKATIRTMGGIRVQPDHSFADCPDADILVIPGGNTSALDGSGLKWLKKAASKADIVMSVCMGAFLLAEADLLDGQKATTHRWGLDSLGNAAPKCTVVRDKRFVDNGKIITTGGVTAGIDGALHVVKRLCGAKVADWTAKEWMEYRVPKNTSGKKKGE